MPSCGISHWCLSAASLSVEHVQLLSNNVLEVTEIARKATGFSAVQQVACQIKLSSAISLWRLVLRIVLALLLFFELSLAHATSARFHQFKFRAVLDMSTALQRFMSPALSVQPGLGTPAEYTIY